MRSAQPAPERTDLVTLLQRLVELTVRLVGGRIELATAQVRDGADRAARTAAWALAGALCAAVALALVGLAAVEALAPLVGNRALRLLIVAAPIVAFAALALRRARRPRAERPSEPVAAEPASASDSTVANPPA